MTDAVTTPPSPPAKDDDNLILDELSDRLATLRILREDDPDARGRMLEEIGVRGKAEEDIVSQMADRKPLWRPDRFEEAHRLAMRSLEVLDRNGVRKVSVPRLGPLTPAAEWSTQQVTRFVVKNHQNTVIDRIRKLYERREANCDWESRRPAAAATAPATTRPGSSPATRARPSASPPSSSAARPSRASSLPCSGRCAARWTTRS